MGISKKQYALAAKAGLTREQASRFIGGAGDEPSPTAAYNKIGDLLKGRSVDTAFKQTKQGGMGLEPGWVGLPKSTALAGIKPIEPSVSQAQPPEQPKVEAATAQELVKPVEQPKPFEKRNIKAVPKALAKKQYYQDFVEYDFSKQDPKLNTLFGNILSGDLFEELGLPLKIKSFKYKSHIWETGEYDFRTGQMVNRAMEFSVSQISESFGYGLNTLMHEAGHLIDAYVGSKITTNKDKVTLRNGKVVGEYLASNHLSDDKDFTNALNIYTTAYKNNDPAVENKLKDFVDFAKKINDEGIDVNLYPEIGEIENKLKQVKENQSPLIIKMLQAMQKNDNETADKYDAQIKEYEVKYNVNELKQKKTELLKKNDKFSTKRTAQAMEDIVASLTLGYGNSKYNLTNGHDIKYYKQRPYGKNHEIFTHYLTMKAHPDRRFINKFKETFPELDKELERLYETAYQVIGSKK